MSKPKRQHFVPKVHLKRFANAEEQVFVFRRGVVLGRWTNIGNVAAERYFNEYAVATDRSSFRIEDLFSTLESWAGSVSLKLLKNQPLSFEEQRWWAMYVAALFLRTRKMREEMVRKAGGVVHAEMNSSVGLRDMQHRLLQAGRLIPLEELGEAVRYQSDLIQAQPAYMQFCNLEDSISNLANIFLRRRWVVSRTSGSRRLVTSDAPVFTAKIENNEMSLGYGFGQETSATFLPLSPKAIFIVCPTSSIWRPQIDDSDVLVLNRGAVQFAHREVYGQKPDDEIQALVDAEIGQIRFGDNAFKSK